MSERAEKPAGLPEEPGPPPLPPVEPPTAAFVVQLFVLPFVVVAVVVVVYLLFGRLAGGERDVADYVREIRSTNANRRWRAAFELASLIQNDESLARDPALLGILGVELDRALADPESDPTLRQYLARTLGAFRMPEGVAEDGAPVDATAVLARALDDGQPTAVRFAAAESLGRLAALDDGRPEHPEAAVALAGVLDAPNAEPELRQLAAYTLGFLGGDAADAALDEAVRGVEDDRFVRYNAAVALGRRGDESAAAVLGEMLRPDDLKKVIDLDDDASNLRRLELIQLEALHALRDAVEDGHPALARRLRPELEALRESDLSSVRIEAAAVLQELQRSSGS